MAKMTFRKSYDFDRGNKVIVVNDLRDDEEVQALIGALASGLPVGGDTGWTLVKASPADGDVEWSPAAGGGEFKNIVETLDDPVSETVGSWEIMDDGSSTATWAERFVMWFNPNGAAARRRTFYLNEYGEARVSPAKNNTVALRLFERETLSDPVHDAGVPLFEIMDNRTDRNVKFQIFKDGTINSPSVGEKVVTWPTGSEPSLAGVPDGTLWVEYTP